MPLRRVFLFVVLLAATGRLQAAAVEDLSKRLQPLASLSSDFSQVLYGSDGQPLETSTGSMQLLRPGFLRWHIVQPDEQVLIASGDTLWHHDVELETATRRSVDTRSPGSPLAILGGDTAQLASQYEVETAGPGSWRLVPLFDDAEFRAVVLVFAEDLPASLRVTDSLGRETVITFLNIRRAPELTPSDFSFAPPPGIDIYDNDR